MTRARGLLAAAATAVVVACAGDSGSPTGPIGSVATAIRLAPSEVRMDALEDTARISAEVIDASGQVIAGAPVWWESSDEAVAPVDGLGLVTGLANGTATVTASSTSGGATVSAAAEVTVEQRLAAVLLEPDSLRFAALGDTAALAARLADANGIDVPGFAVSWSSSDGAVAPVDSAGAVVSLANGTATITASAGGFSAEAAVVVQQVASTVSISPPAVQIRMSALLDTVRLAATVTDANGHVVAHTDEQVQWSSSDASVASVGSSGLVRARGNGSANIEARVGELTGAKSVWVEQIAASVTISPSELNLGAPGDTARLAARVTDRNGHGMPNARITWSSSNRQVARVDAAGLVTAVRGGVAQVTVRSGTVEAKVRVAIKDPERDALVAFYNATNGDDWDNNTNWLSDEPLGAWYGVSTNGQGAVVSVSMWNNRVRGTLPAEIGDLASLFSLYLSNNNLSGPIPREIGRLEQLGRLDLSYNLLSGPIPAELANLAGLTHLYLYENLLSGPLPPALGRLERLEHLSLASNQLEGGIPLQISSLANLRSLDLRDNRLTGAIPSHLSGLARLQSLSLGTNLFTGPVPSWLGSMSDLTSLQLGGNQLTGTIPASLSSLSALESLGLSGNRLTGTIPPLLGDLAGLVYLSLSGNQLTGAIPMSLGNLSALEYLYLSGNRLTGAIPASLGGLSALERLDLSGNQLTGLIPHSLSSLSALETLDLGGNELTGAIPQSLGDLSALESLYLYGNRLTGAIPASLGGLSALERLYLSSNELTGTIPVALGSLSALEWLDISYNQSLSGPLPRSFLNLGRLRRISFHSTGVCAPSDDQFQAWLNALRSGYSGSTC